MASGRGGVISVVASALVLGAALSAEKITAASPGDRTISFYNIHTQERLTVTYKRNGQFVPEALKKINWIMRDWRRNEQTPIDPQTIDLAWEMHEELGSKEPINIICGYRSHSTNELLRRTVGGQASQSQHITGKAIDITFPDVPLKRMRYSALVRERGGVGYYPTSGIPFVHIDTARVRSWPRLPRYELALLFPQGHSQHLPQDGGPISRDDVRVARQKYHDLAVQVAEFQDIRRGVKAPVLVASAKPSSVNTFVDDEENQQTANNGLSVASLTGSASSALTETKRKISLKWEAIKQAAAPKPQIVASLAPEAEPAKPKLAAEPKIVDRSSRFTPSKSDRNKFEALVQQAANMPMPKLITGPQPAQRPQKALAAVAAETEGAAPVSRERQVASLSPEASPNSITDMSPNDLGTGWAQAPEFDEDHPEELAYRPFPLAPLLTDSPSAHDPQLAGLQHPDVAATLAALDDDGSSIPMKFRPGQQIAQSMWAQQFEGKAVHLEALLEIDNNKLPAGVKNHAVKTSAR